MPRFLNFIVLSTAVLTTGLVAAPQEDAAEPPAGAEAEAEGLLPLTDYGGDLWTRTHLLGDLGGERASLAERGVQFNIDWTQIVQGVVDGGRDRTTRYGGTVDFNLTFDLHRMDIMPGAIVTMRGESRYGQSVNGAAGPLLPANTDGFFPLTDNADDDIAFAVTALNYMQFLSSQFALFLGKIETLDGDLNEFASGRGVSQFQNGALVFNPVTAVTVPYSTLAVGALWMPNPRTSITASIMNASDSSTTTGFSDFGDGWNVAFEAQFQYQIVGLPGGQNVGGLYSTDGDFTQLGARIVLPPGGGISVPSSDESWFAYWSGWQYLWTEQDVDDTPIDLRNRVADYQGIGLFARVGFADQNTNPIDWSASIGVGGRGLIPGRDSDTLGLGYFYSSINAERLISAGLIDDRSHGVEGYYSFALTPATTLALDAQLIDDAFRRTDTTMVLGARLQMRF